MPLDRAFLQAYRFAVVEQTYCERNCMLYALGIGIGEDPLDASQLRYVYEKNLVPFPTMGVVLGRPGAWPGPAESGIHWGRTVHLQQSVTLHRPLLPAATITAYLSFENIVDRGAGKGALLTIRRTIVQKDDIEPLCTLRQVLLCRDGGGFDATLGQDHTSRLDALPECEPDVVTETPISARAALLYRLSGDLNPLHVEPGYARRSGFERPPLHGLCTLGIATHALLRAFESPVRRNLASIQLRFSSPVYPGETLRTLAWELSGQRIAFLCLCVERDVIVADNGLLELR